MQEIFTFLQTHWPLTTAVVVILILLIILEHLKNKKNTNALSPFDAIQLINHENAFILDIRSAEAFANGHIVGAQSIPFRELNDKIKRIEKFKTQPLLVVCALGKESHQAMQPLTQKGFTRVYYLQGGIQAWKTQDMPLTKG